MADDAGKRHSLPGGLDTAPAGSPGWRDSYHRRVVQLLQSANLGVTRLDTDPETGEIRLWHRTADGGESATGLRHGRVPGHPRVVRVPGPMLTVLDQGSVLLVDELDSSLHPTLAAEVVRVFQDPASNPRGAQLIFTTHDATLLGSEVLDRPLNRDQVWITVKQRRRNRAVSPHSGQTT